MPTIQLGEYKSKLSSNETNNITLEFKSESQLLFSDIINGDINQYDEYIKEKDLSQKYRIYLTVTPYCSNILFNSYSELVYKEGSFDTVYIGVGNQFTNDINKRSCFINDTNVEKFNQYTGRSTHPNKLLNRFTLLRDTSYSHKDIGGVVYHCGYDIFNNHTLRRNEYAIVNPIGENINNNDKRIVFNTISDYLRDKNGNIEKDSGFKIAPLDSVSPGSLMTKEYESHLYQFDTIDSFNTSITKNLVELNGWIGFINPVSTEVNNYGEISINKCLNNNKPCEFIDMYPDRSLYSFIPKYNKYLLRYEPNWDILLCYAAESFFDNELITHKNCSKTIHLEKDGIDTIKTVKVGDINGMVFYFPNGFDTSKVRTLCKTTIRNTFSKSSNVHIYVIHNNDILFEYDTLLSGLGDNSECEFYLQTSDLEEIIHLKETNNSEFWDNIEFRIVKIINGTFCKYYYRVLKPLDIKQNVLNKLGFSKNIYSDDVVQYLYNSPIDTKDIRDNLGRPITELYATIIKRHKGDEIWYNKHKEVDDWNGEFTADEINQIEYNHCFGELTAGLDLAHKQYDYNVHRIHNVPKIEGETWNELNDLLARPKSLKLNDNDRITSESEKFIGDLVELNTYSFDETVVENMYYRFNTKQREIYSTEFSDMIIDTIKFDDEDSILDSVNAQMFTISSENYNTRTEDNTTKTFPINIYPEGYYYQAHYPIVVREYQDMVQQGKDTRIIFTVKESVGDKHILEFADGYSIHLMSRVLLYRNYDNKIRHGVVIKINGLTFTVKAELNTGESISDYKMFYEQPDKPEFSFNLNDGTGRYYYRELKSDAEINQDSDVYDSVFTNNCHYFHKNINFYLRRQDPYGEYGLSSFTKLSKSQNFIVSGLEKDIKKSITKTETVSTVC